MTISTDLQTEAAEMVDEFNSGERSGFTFDDQLRPAGLDDGYVATITSETFEGELTVERLREFRRRFESLFKQHPNVCLGTWRDGDYRSIDLNVHVSDKQTAKQLGERFNQIAIWDVENFESIETGGDGEPVVETPVEAAGIISRLVEPEAQTVVSATA